MSTVLTGTVFDIQRCSMHDGPGIRTSVFFKGCPLSCRWCHNPESQSIRRQLAFYSDSCRLCGMCSSLCPDVHQITDGVHTVHHSACTFCGKCVDRCSHHALKIIGRQTTVEEIMEVVRKDIRYYKQTGGGLTVTGGEPFSQFDFLKGLLRITKKEQVPTCVETCGHTSQACLNEILPDVDLFLFDYKETNPKLHKQYTGVDPHLIMDNFQFLYSSHKHIILRCPLIPGYNDRPEHFCGIAKMEQRYPLLAGIEIMPYHNLGKAKAHAIGRSYDIAAATADDDLKALWKKELAKAGCSPLVIDSF